MDTQLEKRIAIFASGKGSNARAIIEHFSANEAVEVCRIICNKADAGVLEVAKEYKIPYLVLGNKEQLDGNEFVSLLIGEEVDLIVLAGFLWLLPESIISMFPNQIVNIHPSLLPKYGGKGMYGNYVHKAVLDAKEKESGISIHYVNENFDEGEIIFQAKCEVLDDDTIQSLRDRVNQLELEHYPKVIEEVISKQ